MSVQRAKNHSAERLQMLSVPNGGMYNGRILLILTTALQTILWKKLTSLAK